MSGDTTKLSDDDLILAGSSPTLTIDHITTAVVSSTSSFNMPHTIANMDEAGFQWVDTGVDVPASAQLKSLAIEMKTAATASGINIWISDYTLKSSGAPSFSSYVWVNGNNPGWLAPTDYSGYRGPNLKDHPGYQGNATAFVINGGLDWNGFAYSEISSGARRVWLKVSGSGDISGGTAASVKVHAIYDTWDFS
tara:strand:- start:2487 stop:3068 length:582 start_codon:yes stop_codon:yes gene_type:complete